MRTRWGRTTITLATTGGPHPCEANVFGEWAVHAPMQTTGAIYFHWGVSHVPTGLSVGHGFDKDQARLLCQRLHTITKGHQITGSGCEGLPPEIADRVKAAVRDAHNGDLAPAARPAAAGEAVS